MIWGEKVILRTLEFEELETRMLPYLLVVPYIPCHPAPNLRLES